MKSILNNIRMALIIIIVFIVACNADNKRKTIPFSSPDGKKFVVSCIINVSNDTIFDGLGKYYYLNGKIEKEVNYVNNLLNGWAIFYDTNSIINNKIFYKNGLIDSIELFYDKTGEVTSKILYNKGEKIAYIWLFPNGKIKMIQMLINDSSFYYHLEYDSLGKKMKEDGHAFSLNVEYSFNKKTLPINKTVTIKLLTTAVPNYTSKMKIGWQNSEGAILNVDDMLIDGYYASYSKIFTTPGEYTPVFMGELFDEKSKLVRRDTLSRIIKVIK